MTARDIPGWNSDITPWAEWIAPRIPKGGTYLEIGTFLGASLATMGELRPDINLIAVDPWDSAPAPGWEGLGVFAADVEREGGDLFLAFLRCMLKHAPDVLRRTRVIRGTARTIKLTEAVDFLFIDGAHDFESVKQDLYAFAGCVRHGGIIAGHDYDFPGVKKAVDNYFWMPACTGVDSTIHTGTPDGQSPTCWWTEA
jgi:hypothetical protein